MGTIESPVATGAVWTLQRTERGGRDVRAVIVHTMEAPEGPNTALSVAQYFAGGTVQASAHYCLDADHVVQGVQEWDDAWAAPPSNPWAIQLEHAGYAAQTYAEWSDDYSTRLLERSAQLVADICLRNGITPRHLTDAQLAAGWDGIAGHIQVSAVWSESSHWDPGYSFPWDGYMARVRAYYDAQKSGTTAAVGGTASTTTETPAQPEKDWYDMATKADLKAALKEVLQEGNAATIRKAVHDVLHGEKIHREGAIAGKAVGGTTTIAAEAAWAAANTGKVYVLAQQARDRGDEAIRLIHALTTRVAELETRLASTTTTTETKTEEVAA